MVVIATTSLNVITRQLMIFIVLAGFLLNGNKSKYCVLPDPCAGVPEVPGAGYARLRHDVVSRADPLSTQGKDEHFVLHTQQNRKC